MMQGSQAFAASDRCVPTVPHGNGGELLHLKHNDDGNVARLKSVLHSALLITLPVSMLRGFC